MLAWALSAQPLASSVSDCASSKSDFALSVHSPFCAASSAAESASDCAAEHASFASAKSSFAPWHSPSPVEISESISDKAASFSLVVWS